MAVTLLLRNEGHTTRNKPTSEPKPPSPRSVKLIPILLLILLVTCSSKISGIACPPRFSVYMWGDVRSLCRFAFCFVMGGTLISPGFPIHSQMFLVSSLGINLDGSCVFVKSNLSLAAPNLVVLCALDRPPPFCLIPARGFSKCF